MRYRPGGWKGGNQVQLRKPEMNWPCQAGLGQASPAQLTTLKVRALPQVWSGDVQGRLAQDPLWLPAWTTRLHSPGGPSPPWALGHTHTGPLFLLLTAVSASPSRLLCIATPEQVLGLITATPVGNRRFRVLKTHPPL